MKTLLKSLKKLLKYLSGILFLLLASFTGFLIYALRPGISDQQLPSQKIIQFSSSSSSTISNSIKVATYNIGYASGEKNNKGTILSKTEVEKNLEEMVGALRQLNPDILFLQEVDFDSARSFGINQFRYLADNLHYPYGAYVLTWNKKYIAWPYWPPAKHFGRMVSGQAVLSRFPMDHQELVHFRKPLSNPFWYNWFYINHLIQRLSLQIRNKPVSLYHVHVEAFDDAAKINQMKILTDLVVHDRTPFKIVGGDFNLASTTLPGATPGATVEEQDTEGLLKAFEKTTGMINAESDSPPMSMPSWNPVKKIDHIFYSPAIQLRDSGNLSNLKASDHLPIWAELMIP